MARKRIMGVLLSMALVFSMTACSKSEETTKKSKKEKEKEEELEEEDEDEDESEDEETEDTEESEDTEDTSESEESSEDTTQNSGNGIVDPDANIEQSNAASGIMYIIGDSYDGFGEGIYLLSPSSGTNVMNTAKLRTTFIRDIFENTDHIEVYLAPDAADNLSVYLVPHHDDAAVYTQDYLKTLPDEIVNTKLEDPNDPDWYWGDLSLSEDTYAPGVYDLLFVENGTTPVSYVTIQLVQSGSLSDYTEYDYFAMVKEDLDKHGMSTLYKVDFDKFYGCYEQGIWPDEYTWSGSGLPTLPCENPEATIVIDAVDATSVTIRATLINQSEEESCQAIDEVFQQNNYNISYPDGDADANYRYVYVDIDDVPCGITYYGYEGELIVSIRNLIAEELQ